MFKWSATRGREACRCRRERVTSENTHGNGVEERKLRTYIGIRLHTECSRLEVGGKLGDYGPWPLPRPGLLKAPLCRPQALDVLLLPGEPIANPNVISSLTSDHIALKDGL